MKVTLEQEIPNAESPLAAAIQAYIAIRRRATPATECVITDDKGEVTRVNLAEYLAPPFFAPILTARRSENEEYFLICVVDGSDSLTRIHGPFGDRALHDDKMRSLETLGVRGMRFVTLIVDPFEIKAYAVDRGERAGS